ncbi:hypothetical protein AB0395_19585 [Streptosporangium sp. NPDC051023]|uniref:hypothetical protein n=1 Tax=Streptosporangium sp. NPDC051023 TaxID=3155410 RepID=UPI00344D2CAE
MAVVELGHFCLRQSCRMAKRHPWIHLEPLSDDRRDLPSRRSLLLQRCAQLADLTSYADGVHHKVPLSNQAHGSPQRYASIAQRDISSKRGVNFRYGK